MRNTYKFTKSFGPVASFSGITIFIVGIIAIYLYSLTGLILVILGAFVGFTNASTTIDPRNKRVKFSNNIFGIIKIGKWIHIEKDMLVGIKRVNKVHRTYSRSNRSFDIKVHEKRIYLFDKNEKPILPLMTITQNGNINDRIDRVCSDLGITRIN